MLCVMLTSSGRKVQELCTGFDTSVVSKLKNKRSEFVFTTALSWTSHIPTPRLNFFSHKIGMISLPNSEIR